MSRAILTACLPWLAVLLVLILAAWVLVRSSRAQLHLGRLFELHRDEVGSVQSLSFVLTLPVFIMIIMMIVQVSQLMIGVVVVHYAAFAAARSAAVWIPAGMAAPEGPCCISSYAVDPDAPDQVAPELDPAAADYGPVQRRTDLQDRSGQPQIRQDRLGRDPGLRADLALARPGAGGPLRRRRWRSLEARLWDACAFLRLQRRDRAAAGPQTGLRDEKHRGPDPLLPQEPGAAAGDLLRAAGRSRRVLFQRGRLAGPDHGDGELSVSLAARPGADVGAVYRRSQRNRQGGGKIQNQGGVYTYPLQAKATIGNEGEKSVVTYVYQ